MNFENVNTIEDLMTYIAIHGIPTSEEAVVKMQDIVGHTDVETLAFYANNIGRCDSNGKLDLNGSYSGGKSTQTKFYSLIFHIWNWEDAVRFWNNVTNPDREELIQLREQNKALLSKIDKQKSKYEVLAEESADATRKHLETVDQLHAALARAERAEQEVIELKAKLYDLLIENKESNE